MIGTNAICWTDILEQEDSVTAMSSQKQRSRSVSSAASYSQMTAVFNDVATSPKKFQLRSTPSALDETVTVVHAADDLAAVSSSGSGEISDIFAALNVAALHNLGGGDVLLEVCDTALMYLRRYRIIYEEDLASGQEMKLPTNLSDVLSVRMRCAVFSRFCFIFIARFYVSMVLTVVASARLHAFALYRMVTLSVTWGDP